MSRQNRTLSGSGEIVTGYIPDLQNGPSQHSGRHPGPRLPASHPARRSSQGDRGSAPSPQGPATATPASLRHPDADALNIPEIPLADLLPARCSLFTGRTVARHPCASIGVQSSAATMGSSLSDGRSAWKRLLSVGKVVANTTCSLYFLKFGLHISSV